VDVISILFHEFECAWHFCFVGFIPSAHNYDNMYAINVYKT